MGAIMTMATWGWHAGPWFLVFPLLWIGLFTAVFLVWWSGRNRPDVRSAESMLAERFARGEITDDEYAQRLRVLRQSKVR